MKWDGMSDTVIMIVMWNKNKARLSEPENRLCKGTSRTKAGMIDGRDES